MSGPRGVRGRRCVILRGYGASEGQEDPATQQAGQPAPGAAGPYAAPREVSDIDECFFYHTMDIPGYGHVAGEWDLRGGERAYLGNVEFAGKRVLEIGVASGFLSFYMERQGAQVVGYDLSERQSWDVVPYARYDYRARVLEYKAHLRMLNNGYWLAHRAFGSRARMVYGTVYEIPETIGPVNIATFGSVLLHLRDPFLALQRALRLTKETVIVTERVSQAYWMPKAIRRVSALRRVAQGNEVPLKIYSKVAGPSMMFLPHPAVLAPYATWWHFDPAIVQRFLGILGFEDTSVTFHHQIWRDQACHLFTVVGRRTVPATIAGDQATLTARPVP